MLDLSGVVGGGTFPKKIAEQERPSPAASSGKDRAYKVAASRIGVTDYRNLVEEKLRTAGELYEFMTNEFHQARAFVLELMVVAILVIELIQLFWGRHS